jgi:hypothetical protein
MNSLETLLTTLSELEAKRGKGSLTDYNNVDFSIAATMYLPTLIAIIKELKSAVEFYSLKSVHDVDTSYDPSGSSQIMNDYGKKARAALSKAEDLLIDK